MNIQIHSQGVALTSTLRAHVKLRLGLALGRFAARLGRVLVRLSNVPQVGRRKMIRCQIEVDVVDCVRVEDSNRLVLAAIDHSSDRITRAVVLAFERSPR